MRFPWQGRSSPRASAPSAGVCHRCALIAQVPATRSAAERRHRRDEGAPWHAPQRGRSRAAAAQLAGTGASADRIASTPSTCPAILCDYGHAYPTASAYGTGSGMPCPIPSRFSPTVAIATKSPLWRHTLHHFSAVFRGRSLDVRSSPSPTISSGLSDLRARRRRRYVDVPGPIGTGSPTSACTSSTGPGPPSPSPPDPASRRFRCRSSLQRFPGFSQVSQVPLRFILHGCECRHSN